MNSDTINRSFTKEFNELQAQFDEADVHDHPAINLCIANCRLFLTEHAIPRYHKIQTMLLCETTFTSTYMRMKQ
jgi:hypothetical protein